MIVAGSQSQIKTGVISLEDTSKKVDISGYALARYSYAISTLDHFAFNGDTFRPYYPPGNPRKLHCIWILLELASNVLIWFDLMNIFNIHTGVGFEKGTLEWIDSAACILLCFVWISFYGYNCFIINYNSSVCLITYCVTFV